MLVLLGILVLAAYVGWAGLTQGLGDGDGVASESPSASCTTPPPETVRSRSVTVSVYNAGAPEGQATATMEALTEQGFDQGQLTDAPEPIDVQGIVIWPGDADGGAVELVSRQFGKVRVQPKHKPLGPGVNILVGETFEGLAQKAPRTIAVAQPAVCSPAG
jgi:LytR cell envelope-related transcriptional attenuator